MKVMIDISEEDYKLIKEFSFHGGDSIPANRAIEAIKNGIVTIDIFFNTEPWFDDDIKKIEAALGFKLFTWQQSYITCGTFRYGGKTTAEILRDLLYDVDADPIDLRTKNLRNHRERFYYDMMVNIYQRLRTAGIKTRKIIGRGGREITV